MKPLHRQWIPNIESVIKPLTAAEITLISAQAIVKLKGNKKPVPYRKQPVALFTLGAPGAGKSTTSQAALSELKLNPDDFCVFDTDEFAVFHPDYSQASNITNSDGVSTGIGYAQANTTCIEAILPAATAVLDELIDNRYNVIIQTHDYECMIYARDRGYRIILLYVVTRLQTAQLRAAERGRQTGMFIANSLVEQNDTIARLWIQYRKSIPLYAQWCDILLLANNDKDNASPKFRRVDPHGAWPGILKKIHDQVSSMYNSLPGDLKHVVRSRNFSKKYTY